MASGFNLFPWLATGFCHSVVDGAGFSGCRTKDPRTAESRAFAGACCRWRFSTGTKFPSSDPGTRELLAGLPGAAAVGSEHSIVFAMPEPGCAERFEGDRPAVPISGPAWKRADPLNRSCSWPRSEASADPTASVTMCSESLGSVDSDAPISTVLVAARGGTAGGNGST